MIKPLNVLDLGNNYDEISDEANPDPIAAAVVALDQVGGFAELSRRGRTLKDYLDGKIPGMTPAQLIARMETQEGT